MLHVLALQEFLLVLNYWTGLISSPDFYKMDTLIEFCILFILLSVTVRWTLTAGTDGGRLRERREREDFTKVWFYVLLTLIYLLS